MRRQLMRCFNNGKVDVTDPCYDRDIWCRINQCPVKPGKYRIFINISDYGAWGGKRVTSIVMRHVDYDKMPDWECIGYIGVDAGMAGFFENKPDFDNAEWDKLINKVFCKRDKNDELPLYGTIESGVWANSGFGDGSYHVFKGDVNGQTVALKIKFI